jgi:hypothetical protein
MATHRSPMGIIGESGSGCQKNDDPDRMEAATFVLSIIAILLSLMSAPAALQMFCGGPLIRFDFSEIDGPNAKLFYCSIYSVPIQSKILRKLGVRRERANISVSFRIHEAGGNKIILNDTQAKLVKIGDSGDRGSIVATVSDPRFGVSFDCAFHVKDKGFANAMDPFMKTVVSLEPGRYRFVINSICGEKVFSRWQEMTVGTDPTTTYWTYGSNY